MKASDFVSTSMERDDAALRLIQTEETDAVNSGIVGSADKSGSTIKGASAIHKAAKGGVSNAALAAATGKRKSRNDSGTVVNAGDSASFADVTVSPTGDSSLKSYLKGGEKAVASGVAANVVGKTLEGTELEGADDLYYKGKAARNVIRYARRRFSRASNTVDSTKSTGKRELSLSGRNTGATSAEKPLGALSEKGTGRKAKSAIELKRKAQMSSYFKRSVYSTAAQQTAAKAAVSKSATVVVQGGVKGFLSAAASAAAPFLLGAVALILVIGIISAICGGAAEEERQKAATMEGMPQWVTYDLVLSCLEAHEQYGYPASALLGQMLIENGTSDAGSTLGREYHNYGGIKCSQSMLSSYPDLIVDRVQLLTTEYSNGTAYNTYAYFAVFASDKAYMTYRCEHLYKQPNYTSVPDFQRAIDNNDSELFLRALGEGGYYTASQDDYIAQYRAICESYPLVAQLDSMTSEDFKNGVGGSLVGGQDYASASAVQRRIVDACYRVPSPGAGWCAAWVTNVYRAAGLSAPSGNACCMYLNYCTSSNPDDLKVGMIVAYQQSKTSHGISNYGHLGYGHVGIYIGDGMVMSNRGNIVTETLEQFASSRYPGCDVKWGYPPGVS